MSLSGFILDNYPAFIRKDKLQNPVIINLFIYYYFSLKNPLNQKLLKIGGKNKNEVTCVRFPLTPWLRCVPIPAFRPALRRSLLLLATSESHGVLGRQGEGTPFILKEEKEEQVHVGANLECCDGSRSTEEESSEEEEDPVAVSW